MFFLLNEGQKDIFYKSGLCNSVLRWQRWVCSEGSIKLGQTSFFLISLLALTGLHRMMVVTCEISSKGKGCVQTTQGRHLSAWWKPSTDISAHRGLLLSVNAFIPHVWHQDFQSVYKYIHIWQVQWGGITLHRRTGPLTSSHTSSDW